MNTAILEKLLSAKIKLHFPYEEFRTNQFEVITKILRAFLIDKKRVVALDSPTGTGKSVIAYTVAKVISDCDSRPNLPKTVTLTKTKSLQHQYSEEFDDMSNLWGQATYDCHVPEGQPFREVKSKLTTHARCSRPHTCDYAAAKNEFVGSDLGLTNYAFYKAFGSQLYGNKTLICDEAHSLEDIVLGQYEVSMSLEYFEKFLIPPAYDTLEVAYKTISKGIIGDGLEIDYKGFNKEVFIEVFNDEQQRVNRVIKVLKAQLEDDPKSEQLSKDLGLNEKHSKKVEKTLEVLSTLADDDTWVIYFEQDSKRRTIKIKPLIISENVPNIYLSPGKERVLLLSATFCGIRPYVESLNITPQELAYISCPYIFPLENRPFFCVDLPAMNYSNKKEMLPLYVEVMDHLLDNHIEVRGIVHSVSYANAEYIRDNSKHGHRVFIPNSYELRNIEKYMKKDTILVSPAILEGVDLLGNLSEFQIYLKVPYANLGDIWVSNKKDLSQDWYLRDTAIKIVQGSGRSIRCAEDKCPTYMLDSAINRVLNYKKGILFPKWFHDTVQEL